MRLDHNQIVIRERGWLDLLDLALRVIRAHAWPLAATLIVGIAPFAIFNAWLLSGISEPSFDEPFPAAYMWWMLILVLLEMPLATSLATLYLGEAVFLERPSVRTIVRNFRRSLPQMIWYQLLFRAFLIPPVVTWFMPFAIWPYLNEVILLERNPFRRRWEGQITTFRRSIVLHGGSAGDLFARWLLGTMFGSLLWLAFWMTMMIFAKMLLNEKMFEGPSYTQYYPLTLWMVVGYFTVARFLGYLDLRIRREGWEVELLMRAEAITLSRQLT